MRNRNLKKARLISGYGKRLTISPVKGKRFRVETKYGAIDFGQWPLSGPGTFLDHGDENIKQNWYKRHLATPRGRAAYNDPKSPLFHSARVLWE